MKFDEVDLQIFDVVVRSAPLSSTSIAKLVFEPKNRDELVSKNTLVSYRMKKWVKIGLVKKRKMNKVSLYSLNEGKVSYGESVLSVNGKKIDLGEALIIDLDNNGYIIKFMDEE